MTLIWALGQEHAFFLLQWTQALLNVWLDIPVGIIGTNSRVYFAAGQIHN
jgi:hypothetical protein